MEAIKFRESRKFQFEQPYIRNVKGNYEGVNQARNWIMPTQSREDTQSEQKIHTRFLNPVEETRGIRVNLYDKPKSTIKETTLYFDNSGNVSSSFNTGDSTAHHANIANVEMRSTHKESTLVEDYLGPAKRTDATGYGYITNNYEPREADKIYIEKYIGNPNWNVETRDREAEHNMEINERKQELLKGERPVNERNHSIFQISGSRRVLGQTYVTDKKLLNEKNYNVLGDKINRTGAGYQNTASKKRFGNATRLDLHTNTDNKKTIYVRDIRNDVSLVNTQLDQNPYSVTNWGRKKLPNDELRKLPMHGS